MAIEYIFYNCIRRTFSRDILYSETYDCRRIDNIIDLKIPPLHSEEYLIPLCSKTPESWVNYYLEKKIKEKIRVNVMNQESQ